MRAGSPDSSSVPTQLWKIEGSGSKSRDVREDSSGGGGTDAISSKLITQLTPVQRGEPNLSTGSIFPGSSWSLSSENHLVSVLQFSLHGESEINNADELEMTSSF